VRDADVDDALHPGALGRQKQCAAIGDGEVVIDRTLGGTDPIGIKERGRPFERRHQADLIIEIEW